MKGGQGGQRTPSKQQRKDFVKNPQKTKNGGGPNKKTADQWEGKKEREKPPRARPPNQGPHRGKREIAKKEMRKPKRFRFRVLNNSPGRVRGRRSQKDGTGHFLVRPLQLEKWRTLEKLAGGMVRGGEDKCAPQGTTTNRGGLLVVKGGVSIPPTKKTGGGLGKITKKNRPYPSPIGLTQTGKKAAGPWTRVSRVAKCATTPRNKTVNQGGKGGSPTKKGTPQT